MKLHYYIRSICHLVQQLPSEQPYKGAVHACNTAVQTEEEEMQKEQAKSTKGAAHKRRTEKKSKVLIW